MTEATQPWAGLYYAPVRGLTDRRIARYLRTQRKNMRRFFAEHGMFDELEQMERIRKSRQRTVAKNEMFREVLDAYAKRITESAGATPQPGPEAAHQPAVPIVDQRPEDAVAVQAAEGRPGGDGVHAGDGVPGVAVDGGTEPVIEE